MMSYTNFCTALKVRPMIESTIMALTPAGDCMAKPQDSLTAPIRDHSAQLSLTILDIFLDAINKAKKLILKSLAQNLEQDSLTWRLFSFGNGG